MSTCDNILTIGTFLKGLVRGVEVSDEALASICARAEVESSIRYFEASKKQRDLSTAYLYLWIAGGPTQYGGYSESDADWKKSENSVHMSQSTLDDFKNKAIAILDEYGISEPGAEKWGFVGLGFCNPRKIRS